MNCFVYIIQCADNTLYTGWTTNLEARLNAHESGAGAKYTRGRGPLTLVYSESFETKSEAMRREVEIKSLTRSEKLRLIKEQQKGES